MACYIGTIEFFINIVLGDSDCGIVYSIGKHDAGELIVL